ncbi:MAG TPA: serine hydrolase domain-containing protein [Allosphingosinicella sp.]
MINHPRQLLNAGRRASLALALVAGCTPPTTATAPNSAERDVATQLGACFDAQTAVFPFNGIVHAERGPWTFTRTAGALAPSEAAQPRADTPYSLASVSKVFTNVAIGQLVDQGRVSLDAPIGTYLPDLPPAFAAITLDQLIHHRSGVASFLQPAPEWFEAVQRARTARDLVPLVTRAPLAFRPGEREEYSNGGYVLAGAVVEAVTGKPFADHLEEAIFRPLGMTRTSLDPIAGTAMPMTRLSPPGAPPSEELRPVPMNIAFRATPAGSARSTAEDLTRFGRALLGEALLRPETRARLFRRRGEPWRIGGAGGNIGTNTDFAVLPELGWVVVVLSNYDPPSAETMARVLHGVLAGRGCRTVSEADAPSPFGPPAGQRRRN